MRSPFSLKETRRVASGLQWGHGLACGVPMSPGAGQNHGARIKPVLIGAALSCVLTFPVQAYAQTVSWTCTFITICKDDVCTGVTYEATLTLMPMALDAGVTTLRASFDDSTESFKLAGTDQNGLQRLSNIDGATGARLLTIWPDRAARYTTHIADPAMSMTYMGRCEETE